MTYSQDEKNRIISLRESGAQWKTIAKIVKKTPDQLRVWYSTNCARGSITPIVNSKKLADENLGQVPNEPLIQLEKNHSSKPMVRKGPLLERMSNEMETVFNEPSRKRLRILPNEENTQKSNVKSAQLVTMDDFMDSKEIILDFSTIKRNQMGRLGAIKQNQNKDSAKFPSMRLKSYMPFFKLPHASYAAEGSSSKIFLTQQIQELFASPVAWLYCNASRDDFFGIPMEYALRKALGAEVPPFENITGWLGEPNPYKEMIGYDLVTEKQQRALLGLEKSTTPLPQVVQESEKLNEIVSNVDQTDFMGKEQDEPWGEFSKRMEKEWSGHESLQDIYEIKRYRTSGIYYLESATEQNEVKKSKFQFLFPIEDGDLYLKTEKHFELPPDILKFKKLHKPEKEKIRKLRKERQPLPPVFSKISSNIFVDRKPKKHERPTPCSCEIPSDKGCLGCGEECLNRCMFIECDDLCPLGPKCGNQRISNREYVRDIAVVETEGRGFGIKTQTRIKKDQYIVEYCGEIISQETCVKRMSTDYKDMHHYYFLDYDNGEVVDGCQKGSIARFINHSCDPNCRIEKWTVGSEFRIGVFAEKDIEIGEELTYDYKFESFGLAQKCLCGAKSCRGIIGIEKKLDAFKDTKRSDVFHRVLSSPPQNVKKKSSITMHDRNFWIKKQAQDQLDSIYKDTIKNRYYFVYIRLFLIRNIRETYMYLKNRKLRRGQSSDIKFTSCPRLTSRNQSDDDLKCSRSILIRRRRSLDIIIKELWLNLIRDE